MRKISSNNISINDIEKLKNIFNLANKIVVFTGAGVSTNSGIPDFRGENGIYKIVKEKYNLPYPEAIFSIEYFLKNPQPFYQLSKEFFNTNIKPTKFHYFLSKLEKEGKDILIVTQNIDMLHQKAGNKNVIECHGSYQKAHCTKCNAKFDFSEYEENLKNGQIFYCSKCNGIVKPDIVFFGEKLPNNFFKVLYSPPECDILLVAGTSLTVQPANLLPLSIIEKKLSKYSIIVNKEETFYDNYFDYSINYDTDSFVELLSEKN